MVVVDRLTKYAHFLSLKHSFSASTVANLFCKEVIRLHGTPTTIGSDSDKIFLSLFWKEIFRLHCTALHQSTSYHPQLDGQIEVLNRSLESYMECCINGRPKTRGRWLHCAEYRYNTSWHASSLCTLFKAMAGTLPTSPNTQWGKPVKAQYRMKLFEDDKEEM